MTSIKFKNICLKEIDPVKLLHQVFKVVSTRRFVRSSSCRLLVQPGHKCITAETMHYLRYFRSINDVSTSS